MRVKVRNVKKLPCKRCGDVHKYITRTFMWDCSVPIQITESMYDTLFSGMGQMESLGWLENFMVWRRYP